MSIEICSFLAIPNRMILKINLLPHNLFLCHKNSILENYEDKLCNKLILRFFPFEITRNNQILFDTELSQAKVILGVIFKAKVIFRSSNSEVNSIIQEMSPDISSSIDCLCLPKKVHLEKKPHIFKVL